MTTMTTPSVEYSLLAPILIVFIVAGKLQTQQPR